MGTTRSLDAGQSLANHPAIRFAERRLHIRPLVVFTNRFWPGSRNPEHDCFLHGNGKARWEKAAGPFGG